MIGHKCNWLVCFTHINELSIRYLITVLDGPSIPKSGFTVTIGELLHKINDLKVTFPLQALPDANKVGERPDEIVKSMSTDQKNCYRLISPVQSRKLSSKLAKIKCGLLNSSIWITTAEAFMMLWILVHNIAGDNRRKLEVIVRFIIDCYIKMFFDIKVQHHLITAYDQTDEVQNIITPTSSVEHTQHIVITYSPL